MSIITHPQARELSKSLRAAVVVFEDPKSRELLERIERIAPSDATVMIIGETGTGKELVARRIHDLSERRNGPFVALNCGAFPETLVESELFGHEKGAFTGALAGKMGWFEAANGGTLFLDEIGDLPLGIQVKLLRVLQEREIVRLGSRIPVPLDVRLVVATNVDLAQAVKVGNFREDLFYRLHVAPLDLLPLRERRGDIRPLAEFFVAEHGERLGRSPAQLSAAALAVLLDHNWPGNIRELENTIHHALLVCSGGLIQPDDIQLVGSVRSVNVKRRSDPDSGSVVPALERCLIELFEQAVPDLHDHIEASLFRAAYRFCDGNQVQTARLLGLSRNIVRARLEKIGLLRTHLRTEPVLVSGTR